MKTLLAFVLGGLLVWAVMNHHKPAPVVQASQQAERATLHEQMECAAATERYVKANVFDPSDDATEHGSATLHSHYDAVKGQCVGLWDWEGAHIYGPAADGSSNWYSESIDVFDPVEGHDIAGGYWKSKNNSDIYQAKSFPRGIVSEEYDRQFKSGGTTVGQFYAFMSDQYGISE